MTGANGDQRLMNSVVEQWVLAKAFHQVHLTFFDAATARLVPKNAPGSSNLRERVVGVPSLWPRPGGVLQQHGLGVSRQLDRAQLNCL